MEEILVGNFKASKDEKGLWVYKHDPEIFFKSNVKNLKIKLTDKPRYKVVLEIENDFKKNTDKFLSNLTIDIVKKLKQLSNEK